MANLSNVKRYISAGFARLDFHQLDQYGLPAGVTGVVVAGANGVAAGRINAVTTMNAATPAAVGVPIPGDNVLQGTFMFPNDQPRTFPVQFSEDDFADRQAMQSIIPRDIGNFSFAGRDTQPFVLNNMMFIGVSNAKARTAGVAGLGMYAGVFATRAQMVAQGRAAFANRAAGLFAGTITLNAMDAYPWGETFKTSVEGYVQSFIEDWTLAYPVTCHRWTQSSGAVTKFFLGETPASTSLNDVLVYVLDTNQVPTRKTSGVTISTVDNSITFDSAPTAGYDIVCWYGYVPS
jgi:hypothetical protein